ncbi:peptidoglycan/LPS O-acetylase OafA/YrhL [Agromyces terreus]|uniref:Peptidoglycan/LPS O-acetylase OafA/YrhL n=1 Tax=Agromyces terreus TaxID=424795 RepID=A0A9X2KDC8_9MICO|nr:acyltransferase [Agromyces terreus]MCP2369447.1 peptidoglycan/LPS O-acetylase OafA/YrhL [Agromyces terreus]
MTTESARRRLIEPETGKRAWVDFAKGAAIVMVVYYHTALYLQAAGIQGTPWLVKAPLELFPMPAFFLIAGLFGNRLGTWAFADLWRRRLLPLLYLYVLWSVLRFAFYLVVPGVNGELGEFPATNPIGLLLIAVWPSSSYWFIYALFLFTLGVWLLRRVPPAVQVAAAAVLSAFVTSGILDANNVGWNRVGGLFVFFLVGALYSKRLFELVNRVRPWMLATAFAVFVAVVAGLILFGLRAVPGGVLLGQVAAVAFGIMASTYLVRLRPLRFVSTLGATSLQIYLFHLYVIVVIAAIVAALGLEVPRWVGICLQLVVMTIAIIVSFLLTRLTSRARWLYVPPTWMTRRRGVGVAGTATYRAGRTPRAGRSGGPAPVPGAQPTGETP